MGQAKEYSPEFIEGYQARGKTPVDTKNPYSPGTKQHADWVAGHDQRDDELAW